MNSFPKTDRVSIDGVETLSDDYTALRKYRLRQRRRNGTEQALTREVYHRGDAATILLFSPERHSVILTRQFRLPALLGGDHDGMLVETPAGMLDGEDPGAAIRREVEEETGFRIAGARRLFAAYMCPGAVTERLHFFAAEFSVADRVGEGGGHPAEGEDIETMEVPFADAFAMIDDGRIIDAKTIMLLAYAKAIGLMPA